MFKWFRDHSFQWQLYWKSWTICHMKDSYCDFDIHTLCIGPIQMRWYNG